MSGSRFGDELIGHGKVGDRAEDILNRLGLGDESDAPQMLLPWDPKLGTEPLSGPIMAPGIYLAGTVPVVINHTRAESDLSPVTETQLVTETTENPIANGDSPTPSSRWEGSMAGIDGRPLRPLFAGLLILFLLTELALANWKQN